MRLLFVEEDDEDEDEEDDVAVAVDWVEDVENVG